MTEEIALHQEKEVTGFRLVLGYLGMFMVLIGIINAFPMIVVAFYRDEYGALPIFASVVASNLIVGFLLYFLLIYKKKRSRFRRHQESMLLILTWLCAILSGAAPFFIAHLLGEINMTFSGAFFEATSGFSTTGLTVFEEFIDTPGAFCPHVFTFHRALMNFIGGVGLVLLVASVLGAGGGGVALYVSEGHSDRLLPNIARSAKLIFGIYTFYTLLGIVALLLAGMPIFDAVCHSMAALSGGGFSPRAENVAAFRSLEGLKLAGAIVPVNSLAIELIMVVLVCLSAISFMLHTFLLRGKFKDFFRDAEIRYIICCEALFLLIAFFAVLFSTSALHAGGFFNDSGEVLRFTVFYTFGCWTNSGFASTTSSFPYHIIPGGTAIYAGHTLTVLLIILMLIGGGAGSSAGGIKQYRVVVAIRSLYYSLRYRFASIHERYPRVITRYGETKELDEGTIHEAHHYIFLFFGMFMVLTLVLLFVDPAHYDFESAAFDMASAVSNTGLSWVIGPAYVSSHSVASFVTLWAMSIGMLLGRLEILPAAYAVANVHAEIHYKRGLRQRARREAEALKMMEEGE